MQQQNYNQQQNQQNYNPDYGQPSKVAKTMNATIVTGEYFSKKENKNKKSYLTIGKLFIYANGGMSLKLDVLPIGGNQTINFYDIKPKPQPNQQGYNQQGYSQNQPHQGY
jgi:hypothetical protein